MGWNETAPPVGIQAPPPQQREFEHKGTVYRFPHNWSNSQVERWFGKQFASERTLSPEQAGGASQAIDSPEHAKLRADTPLHAEGVQHYADLLSGGAAKSEFTLIDDPEALFEPPPTALKPEQVRPQMVRQYADERDALSDEMEASVKKGEKKYDPGLVADFREDTRKMREDTKRRWSNETTDEYHNRILDDTYTHEEIKQKAIESGLAEKHHQDSVVRQKLTEWKLSTRTPEEVAADEAILKTRPEYRGWKARQDQEFEPRWAESHLRELRAEHGDKVPLDKQPSFSHAERMYSQWLRNNPDAEDPEFDLWRSRIREKRLSDFHVRKTDQDRNIDTLSEAMVVVMDQDAHGTDWVPYSLKRIPIAGHFVSATEFLMNRETITRFNAGKATENDLISLARIMHAAEQEKNEGVLKKAWDIASMLPAFGVEFALTGGVFTAARAGVRQLGVKMMGRSAMRQAIPRLATKGAAATAGVAAQTAANVPLWASEAAQSYVPEYGLTRNEAGELTAAITGDDPSLAEAIAKGYGKAFIEMGSERSWAAIGKLFGPKSRVGKWFLKLPGAAQVKVARAAIAQQLLKRGIDPRRTKQILEKAGFQSAPEEIFEERVADMAGGVTGLEDDFGTTGAILSRDPEGWKQLKAEAAAFALLPIGGAALMTGEAATSQEARDWARIRLIPDTIRAGGKVTRAQAEALNRRGVTLSGNQDARTREVQESGIVDAIDVINEIVGEEPRVPPAPLPENSANPELLNNDEIDQLLRENLTGPTAADVANKWDTEHKNDRQEAWFIGGIDAESGFAEAQNNGGSKLQAHGMTKSPTLGAAIRTLLDLFRNDIDPNRNGGGLDTAQLTNDGNASGVGSGVGTSGGTAYREGAFILVAKPDAVNGIRSVSDIAAVLVNEAHAELVPSLQAELNAIQPGVIVDSYANAGRVASEVNKGTTQDTTEGKQAQDEDPDAEASPEASYEDIRDKYYDLLGELSDAQGRGEDVSDSVKERLEWLEENYPEHIAMADEELGVDEDSVTPPPEDGDTTTQGDDNVAPPTGDEIDSVPTEPSDNTETDKPNDPWSNMSEWARDNLKSLAEKAEASGIADKIEELAAQRKTAKEIANELGIDQEMVIAVRINRGIPSWTNAVTLAGAPNESEEFRDWLDARERKKNEAPTTPVEPVTPQPDVEATTDTEAAPESVEKSNGTKKPAPADFHAEVLKAIEELSDSNLGGNTSIGALRKRFPNRKQLDEALGKLQQDREIELATANSQNEHDATSEEDAYRVSGLSRHMVIRTGKGSETDTGTAAGEELGVDEAPPTDPAETERSPRQQLTDHFHMRFMQGGSYPSIIEARREAAEILGEEDVSKRTKEIDEAIEQGVVRAARDLVDLNNPRKTFDALVDLYEQQPNLGTRTSGSVQRQAYSTPAPLAFLANTLARVSENTSVYDSSAGNGMLLVGASLKRAQANEIDPDRAAFLKELGPHTTENDATGFRPNRNFQAVIINPPFGKVFETEGHAKSWTVDGVTTSEIDHAITIQSLQSLQPEGRAVLILGAKGHNKDGVERAKAYSSTSQKPFYDYLYDNFNVTDHFTVSGDLYARQGAKFPVDVIVIDGKGESSRPRPWNVRENGVPEVYNEWEELADAKLALEPPDPSVDAPSGGMGSSERPTTEDGQSPDVGPVPRPPTGKNPVAGGGGGGSSSSSGTDVVGSDGASGSTGLSDTSGPTTGGGGTSGGSGSGTSSPSESVSGKGKKSTSGGGGDRSERPDNVASERTAGEREVVSEFQTSYTPQSKHASVGALLPANHVDAVERALSAVIETHGDIDAFVARELGYDEQDLGNYFSAEQVDALALAIANHKRESGFILGDQTGMGKGRVVAGMVVYAMRNGFIPVFVTAKPKLYADLIRDLTDIGKNTEADRFRPLVTNDLTGDKKIPLPDGRTLSDNGTKNKSRLLEAIKNFDETGELTVTQKGAPVKYHAIFTTYSQLRPVGGKETWRHVAFDGIKEQAYFLLDESHLAGGSGSSERQSMADAQNTAGFVRHLIGQAPGVLYSSATFAKNPNVMDLYFRTDISKAVENIDELADALTEGGTPLQQVLSEMLVESGQYLRRERSYEGVGFDAETVDVGLENADSVSEVFREINELDRLCEDARDNIEIDTVSDGGGVSGDASTGTAGIESTNFTSILWNLIDQMLVSLKADQAAEAAIRSVQSGQSPVIVVDGTLEAALNHYLADQDVGVGDSVDFTFGDLLRRYLERSRDITIRNPDGTKTRIRLSDAEIGPEAARQYNKVSKLIDDFSADIPASPIDWMRYKLEQAGMSVREITGRDRRIAYSDHGTTLEDRDKSERGTEGQTASIDGFNAGTTQVLIINRSASTGLSLHASEKFSNQKPRRMIIAQAAKNIDDFMQVLGRIHRTGQVTLPTYTLLLSNAPAENRPAAVLTKKLSSLNANVTGAAAGAVGFDAPDILNVIGDRIVFQFMEENAELNWVLGSPLKTNAAGQIDSGQRVDCARKVTGRLALLPVAQQQEIWDELTYQFEQEIKELDNRGVNPLVAHVLPLEAQTKERFEVFDGDTESSNPFEQPAYIERVAAKRLGKPLTSQQVNEKIAEAFAGQSREGEADYATPPMSRGEWVNSTIAETKKRGSEWARTHLAKIDDPAVRERRGQQLNTQYEFIIDNLRRFAPGAPVLASFENVEMEGIVVGIKAPGAKANPLAPSRWTVQVAVLDSVRMLNIPFSKIETLGSQFSVSTQQRTAEFDTVETKGRETRFIVTGNLLAGHEQLAGQGGRIVFFTDSNKETRRGILMPRTFDADRWRDQRPVAMESVDLAMEFLSRGGFLATPDGNLVIRQFRGALWLRAPKTKKRGGRYFLNRAILDAAAPEEFTSTGQYMDLYVPAEKQRAVLEAVIGQFSLQATEMRDIARDVVRGQRKPIQPKSTGTRKPSKDSPVSPSSSTTPRPTVQQRADARTRAKEHARIAASDIMRTLESIFELGVKHGQMGSRSRMTQGFYSWISNGSGLPSPEVARIRETWYADLGVLTHEIAHHIDEKWNVFDNIPKDIKEELANLDYEEDRRDRKLAVREGFAEFVRRYLTGREIDVNGTMRPNTIADARRATEWFENELLKNQELKKKIEQAREYCQDFANQTLFRRLSTLISDRKPQDLRFKERWRTMSRTRLNRLKTQFIDKFHILKDVQREAQSRGYKGIGVYDLTMAYYMSAPSHATMAFEEGVHDLGTGRKIGSVALWDLRNHLKTDSEYEEAAIFSLARHTLFMAETKPGFNTGMTVESAQEFIDELDEEKQRRFTRFAEDLAQFNNDLLEMMVSAGALSSEDKQTMVDYYGDRNYFPLWRVQDTEQSFLKGTGAGFVNLGRPIKGRSERGSGRQIIDPIDATVSRAMMFYSRAIKARQAHTLAKMLDPRLGGVGGMGGLMDRVPPGRRVTKGNILEILNTLVEEEVIDKDQAKDMSIAARILHPDELDPPSSKQLDWFAERHGLELQGDGEYDPDELDRAATSVPDAMATIALWRPDFTPNAQKHTVVIYTPDGKPVMYEMDKELHDTVTGMDELQFGTFMSLMRETARYFKTGAVGLSSGFGIANLFRDFWEYQGKAKHAKGLESLGKPPVMLGKYIISKVWQRFGHKVDPVIHLYEETGGKLYSRIGHDSHSRRMARRQKMGQDTLSPFVIRVSKRTGDTAETILQSIQDVIAMSDAPPRLADGEAAIREEGYVVKDGKWYHERTGRFVDYLPEHVRIKASIAMSEATINFKRIGKHGQYVEAFLPFFNASIQAMYRQYQQVRGLRSLGQKDSDGMAAKRYLVYLCALASSAVVYWLLRHDDDDWRKQDAWIRDGYWTIGWGGRTYVMIPKPRDTAVVSNVVENVLDSWFHADSRNTTDVILRDLGGRIPSGGGALRGLGEAFVADYDFFRGRDLTPDYLKDEPAEMQFTGYESSASRAIGAVTGRHFGISPIKVQHVLNSASGGLYGRLTELYDASLEGRIGPEHILGLRGVVRNRFQARQVNEFYEQLNAIALQAKREEAAGGVSEETMKRKAVLEGYAELMATIRTSEEKIGLRRSFAYQPYLSGLARNALGYSELQSDPNPIQRSKDIPAPVQDAVREYSARVVRQAAEVEKKESSYKNKETYQRERRSRIRGEEKLKSLGISYEEANELLVLSFALEKAKRTGKPLNGRMRGHYTVNGDYKPSFLAQRTALKKFYGK